MATNTLAKTTARRDARVNSWMASQKMQRDQAAYRKPGSMQHK